MFSKSLKLIIFTAMVLAAVAVQARTVEIEGLDSLKFDTKSITVKPGVDRPVSRRCPPCGPSRPLRLVC